MNTTNIRKFNLKETNRVCVFFVLVFAFLYSVSIAQKADTISHLYSEYALKRLALLSDSVQAKCNVGKSNGIFFSPPITNASLVLMHGGKCKEAKADMDKGVSLKELLKKYPNLKCSNKAPVVKKLVRYCSDTVKLAFIFMPTGEKGSDHAIIVSDTSMYSKKMKNNWVYDYHNAKQSGELYFWAFYFEEEFICQPIPKKYNEFLLYSDCLLANKSFEFCPKSVANYEGVPENISTLTISEKKLILNKQLSSKGFYASIFPDDMKDKAILTSEVGDLNLFLFSHLNLMMNFEYYKKVDSILWKELILTTDLNMINVDANKLLIGLYFLINTEVNEFLHENTSMVANVLGSGVSFSRYCDFIYSAATDSELDYYNRFHFSKILFRMRSNFNYKGSKEYWKLDEMCKKIIASFPSTFEFQFVGDK